MLKLLYLSAGGVLAVKNVLYFNDSLKKILLKYLESRFCFD
ncbi:MAG: hypothetical protein UR66_C0020G0002 [Candidatus Moranbacteria bacterium GW2011_GWE1_35_17]|nr:MAG: hypothetical protein UR66_C0020G0002 [Candidatus Moranbacteria bacterium GW2011_GWE1_35_17]